MKIEEIEKNVTTQVTTVMKELTKKITYYYIRKYNDNR